MVDVPSVEPVQGQVGVLTVRDSGLIVAVGWGGNHKIVRRRVTSGCRIPKLNGDTLLVCCSLQQFLLGKQLSLRPKALQITARHDLEQFDWTLVLRLDLLLGPDVQLKRRGSRIAHWPDDLRQCHPEESA